MTNRRTKLAAKRGDGLLKQFDRLPKRTVNGIAWKCKKPGLWVSEIGAMARGSGNTWRFEPNVGFEPNVDFDPGPFRTLDDALWSV